MKSIRNHPFFAPGLLLLSALLFVLGIWSVRQYFISPYSVPPQELFAGPVPADFKTLSVFRSSNGITASFFDKKNSQKVSFSISFDKPVSFEPISGSDIIKSMIIRQSEDKLDPRLTSFSAAFAGAEFDPRRAQPINEQQVLTPSGVSNAQHFKSVQQWHHAIYLFNIPQGQVLVTAARNGDLVNIEDVATFIGSIKTLQPI